MRTWSLPGSYSGDQHPRGPVHDQASRWIKKKNVEHFTILREAFHLYMHLAHLLVGIAYHYYIDTLISSQRCYYLFLVIRHLLEVSRHCRLYPILNCFIFYDAIFALKDPINSYLKLTFQYC